MPAVETQRFAMDARLVPAFRLALSVAVLVISYLAFTPVQHEVSQVGSDKANHFAAFLALAGLLDFSFPREEFTWRKVAALVGYGLLIEVVQYFLPYREFSLLDLATDGLGLAAYALLRPLCRHLPVLRERWQGDRSN